MTSSRTPPSPRRAAYLRLAGQIEGQLRQAYQRRFDAGEINQSTLAAKLGIGRSVVHRRLSGQTNMTIETIADMAWALDVDIEVRLTDSAAPPPAGNGPAASRSAPVNPATRPLAPVYLEPAIHSRRP